MSDAAQSLRGRRILLVEDDYLIASEMKRWLERAGAEVVGPVPSVRSALALIADGPLDAAVLDINLGDRETAFPIADRLMALGVPHLFATGDIQVRPGSAHGDRPRLEKPFLAEELIRAVEALAKVAVLVE